MRAYAARIGVSGDELFAELDERVPDMANLRLGAVLRREYPEAWGRYVRERCAPHDSMERQLRLRLLRRLNPWLA